MHTIPAVPTDIQRPPRREPTTVAVRLQQRYKRYFVTFGSLDTGDFSAYYVSAAKKTTIDYRSDLGAFDSLDAAVAHLTALENGEVPA